MNKTIMRLFDHGNVCVVGMRGTGKDMLMSNVAVRRRKPYISNINYDGKNEKNFIELDLTKLDVKNDCFSFIEGKINPYVFPYADGTDVYISDSSVYFPNYQTLPLNKRYEGLVNFMALSRQLACANVHINAQNLNRVWEKIPEQSDRYIYCKSCRVFGKIVFQRVIIYQKRDSCEARIPPMPTPRYGLSRRTNFDRQSYELQRLAYTAKYGEIVPLTLIYVNKSNYDTRRFKTILAGDKD